VLHEDGKWYPGKLSECDGGNRWHVVFDDGDSDWYTLPHRDVKIMRERPFGGEAWREFLRKQGIAGNSVSRDYLRNEFVKCIGTTEARPYHQKPTDLFDEKGNLKTRAKAEHETLQDAPREIAMEEEDGEATFRKWFAPKKFQGKGDESAMEKGKRQKIDHNLPEIVRNRLPEAKLFHELQQLERRIDTIRSRKFLEITESLKSQRKVYKRFQIAVFNTVEHVQDVSHDNGVEQEGSKVEESATCVRNPSKKWTLHIAGKLVEDEQAAGSSDAASRHDITAYFDRLFVLLPSDLYPHSHCIEWNRNVNHSGSNKAQVELEEGGILQSGASKPSGFRVTRHANSEFDLRILFYPRFCPMRYSLRSCPELARLIGWQSGTWSSLLVAFWNYISKNGIQHEEDSLYLKLDSQLQSILGDERIPISRISDKLSEIVTEIEPLEIIHKISLSTTSTTSVYETLVEMDDPLMKQMRDLVDEKHSDDLNATCTKLDSEIEDLVSQIEERKQRFDFMSGFAEKPFSFLREMLTSLALDLKVIQSQGIDRYALFRSADLRRVNVWQQPWTEEAVLHYLNSQGYDVPLNIEDAILEEDLLAVISQDPGKSSSGDLVPGSTPGQASGASGHMASAASPYTGRVNLMDDTGEPILCKVCNRFFKSQHALSVHFATAAIHKQVMPNNMPAMPSMGMMPNLATSTIPTTGSPQPAPPLQSANSNASMPAAAVEAKGATQ